MKTLLYSFFLIVIPTSCQKNIHQQITDQIKLNSNKDSCIIDINDFVDFEWNKMYVFPSWSMPDDISTILGFEYNGEYVKDDTRRIIFTKGKKIIFEEDYYIRPGDDIFDFIDSCPTCSFCEFNKSKFITRKIKPINVNDYPIYYKLDPIN